MMNLREYRRSTAQLADFLPWAALVDKGISPGGARRSGERQRSKQGPFVELMGLNRGFLS
jgi:hypothetical protein